MYLTLKTFYIVDPKKILDYIYIKDLQILIKMQRVFLMHDGWKNYPNFLRKMGFTKAGFSLDSWHNIKRFFYAM